MMADTVSPDSRSVLISFAFSSSKLTLATELRASVLSLGDAIHLALSPNSAMRARMPGMFTITDLVKTVSGR